MDSIKKIKLDLSDFDFLRKYVSVGTIVEHPKETKKLITDGLDLYMKNQKHVLEEMKEAESALDDFDWEPVLNTLNEFRKLWILAYADVDSELEMSDDDEYRLESSATISNKIQEYLRDTFDFEISRQLEHSTHVLAACYRECFKLGASNEAFIFKSELRALIRKLKAAMSLT